MEEEGKSKREDWEQKKRRARGCANIRQLPFLPTLTLLLYDEHDVAREEQLRRLNLFASIDLKITSQSLIFL